MLVIFQRRLVYLPYFPPGSRTQELPRSTGTHDHPLLVGLALHKIRFPSTRESPTLDGLLVLPKKPLASPTSSLDGLVFYLQGTPHSFSVSSIVWFKLIFMGDMNSQHIGVGNAGNTLARLPVFRELLVPPGTGGGGQGGWLKLGVFALSPRGYWSSEGPLPFPFTALTRPAYRLHQRGVVADYARVLEELAGHTTGPLASVPIWVHGHSLGGAVAAQLLSHIFFSNHPGTAATRSRLAGLILENPLPSVPHMVKLLYPSRYVPYHYLSPFVRDTWDTRSALASFAGRLPIMFIQSEHDELVPHSVTQELYRHYLNACSPRQPHSSPFVTIPYTLHDSAFLNNRYRISIHRFIANTMPS
jgi:pimeloyl-ACP methyl ester carboxylesterase